MAFKRRPIATLLVILLNDIQASIADSGAKALQLTLSFPPAVADGDASEEFTVEPLSDSLNRLLVQLCATDFLIFKVYLI